MKLVDKVPFLDLQRQNSPLKNEILKKLDTLIQTSSFVLGAEVEAFEKAFQNYTGVSYAISCASGTDALLLALMAANIVPGDEVIVPSFTFFATAGAVARLGAVPIFADIDTNYNIAVSEVERKISKRTKAIIPVHLYGQMANMPAIVKICSSRSQKIFVIEDAAQSIGAAINGKQAGQWGDIAAFSFYPTKNLGAMGDAGLVSAQDAELAMKLKALRVHGERERYYHDYVGINSRLDSFQAAILQIKLALLKTYEAKRIEHAKAYTKLFKEASLSEKVILPTVHADNHHVWNQFTIRVKERDRLQNYLKAKGISTQVYYPLPLHLQRCFSSLGYKVGDLPNCESIAKEVLSIPLFPELKLEELATVVDRIKAFYSV